METVTSRDGTTIAFDRRGAGPALVLVTGALGTRAGHQPLAALLAEDFTVFNYDRRGRADSGDTPPYAVEREVEDIDAVIEAAGGTASLYGISSGAILAVEAASKLPSKVTKLALYEPPFILDDSRPPLPADYVPRLNAAIAAGRPGDAVMLFMTDAIRIPDEYLAPMQDSPMWAGLEAVAHTIAYDGTVVGDTMSGKPLPKGRWAAATMPTLVITGELSEDFFHNGGRSLTADLPDARHAILAGQDHNVSADVLAPVLGDFFAAS